MTRILAIFLLIVATAATAHGHKHKAHVHGVAKLNIVIEGKKATIEFIAPGHDVFGFERDAKTDEEKKKQAAALEKLRGNGETLVKFDEKIACVVTNQKAEIVAQAASDSKKNKKASAHNEVIAEYAVNCPALIAGTDLKFGVTELFSSITAVAVQVLAETKQVGATIKKDSGSVRVPPEVK